jgi:hypothetical protein
MSSLREIVERSGEMLSEENWETLVHEVHNLLKNCSPVELYRFTALEEKDEEEYVLYVNIYKTEKD